MILQHHTGQGVSTTTYLFCQNQVATELQVFTGSARHNKNSTTKPWVYTLASVYFYVSKTLMFVSQALGRGAEARAEDRGSNEKIHNSGLLCLFTLLPSCPGHGDGRAQHTTKIETDAFPT